MFHQFVNLGQIVEWIDPREGDFSLLIDDEGGALGNSGYRRAFCTRCGSHVFGVVDGSEEIELLLGSFDETNVFTPTYEAWTIRRERWLGVQPTLERHFERDRLDEERR